MNNLLTHYRVSFDVPLQEVSTRELYDACRRLMRMIRKVRNEMSHMCVDGHYIGEAVLQPYYSMLYMLEDELYARRMVSSDDSSLVFCSLVHDRYTEEQYLSVYRWLLNIISSDLKIRLDKLRDTHVGDPEYNFACLGWGRLKDYYRLDINRHAVDELPF